MITIKWSYLKRSTHSNPIAIYCGNVKLYHTYKEFMWSFFFMWFTTLEDRGFTTSMVIILKEAPKGALPYLTPKDLDNWTSDLDYFSFGLRNINQLIYPIKAKKSCRFSVKIDNLTIEQTKWDIIWSGKMKTWTNSFVFDSTCTPTNLISWDIVWRRER